MTTNRFASFGIAVALLAAATVSSAFAQEKHDSNTLHKLGGAIQYPLRKAGENASKSTHKGAKDVRKATVKGAKDVQYVTKKTAENTSVTAHRATKKNSVVRRHNGSKRHDTVVTPVGDLKRIH